ncbi:MAG TPA: hypothetical protein VHM20_08480 [Gammaproteobacteria bacterium]|jgi:hypothetical protein|nr:hypothetical protein [Gammaproteobacteria bacterium]
MINPSQDAKEKKEILHLKPLQDYLKKKCFHQPFDIKNFSTPLDLAKFKLAEMLQQRLERTSDIEIRRKTIFIIYKINEFLENPVLYAKLETPLQSPLTNRRDFYDLINASQVYGVDVYADIEMERLFGLFQKMYLSVEIPEKLPSYLNTGSSYFWRYSTLHIVIQSLYENCTNNIQNSLYFG